MFDFLTFSAISGSALDFFDVMKTPIAVLIGVGLGLMIASWILGQFGVGVGGDSSPGGIGSSPAGGARGGRSGRNRRRYTPPRGSVSSGASASDQEWASLENNARDVNGYTG